MNNLKGKIASFESQGDLSIVKINVDENTLKAIVIENPDTSTYLKKDREVNVYFKETEVVIAKNPSDQISLENRINCIVSTIEKGKILSNVELINGENRLNSVISTESLNAMNIVVNDEVTAMVKMNEIMIVP